MTNEPNKRFPRVSDCCKKTYKMLYNNDPSSTQQYIPICTSCDNQCKIVADEGLPDDENRERRCTHGGVPGATWCTDCAAFLHDPNFNHDFSNTESQPSAPSMSIEEARELLKAWSTDLKDFSIKDIPELIEKFIEASALIAASEQRGLAGKILTNMLEENLKNEYYFGVFGKVKNREFVENFKTNLSDSQQNISSKKSEL